MYASVNGVRLFFDVEGAKLVPDGPTMRERPTLILLHGGPGLDHSATSRTSRSSPTSRSSSISTTAATAAATRAIPRTGRSRSGRDDVRAFCDALGIEKPIVLGQWFGGMVAMAYAARHPGHAGKLVFSSTAARNDLAADAAALRGARRRRR